MLLIATLALILTGCDDKQEHSTFNNLLPSPNEVLLKKNLNVSQAKKLLAKHNYALKRAIQGKQLVPPIFFTRLPRGMKRNKAGRKELFIKIMLPLILRCNRAIQTEKHLLEQYQRKKMLKPSERAWLKKLFKKYRVKQGNFKELVKRVDVVPVSLYLGQAIVESGWGTSYSALVRNALFGVTFYNRLLSFKDLATSIRNYMWNLNINPLYEQMRNLRYKQRITKQPSSSLKLIEKLIEYCEFKQRYVNKVKKVIGENNLQQFDDVMLSNISVDSHKFFQ